MIPLRHWIYIGVVVALVAGANWALTQAYNNGVADQVALQEKIDALRLDINNAEKTRIEQKALFDVAAADAAADRANTANNGLQRELDTIKRIAADAAGPLAAGTSARNAVILLADLLGQCGERYKRMAVFADKSHQAGRTCQAQYESLRAESPR